MRKGVKQKKIIYSDCKFVSGLHRTFYLGFLFPFLFKRETRINTHKSEHDSFLDSLNILRTYMLHRIGAREFGYQTRMEHRNLI